MKANLFRARFAWLISTLMFFAAISLATAGILAYAGMLTLPISAEWFRSIGYVWYSCALTLLLVFSALLNIYAEQTST